MHAHAHAPARSQLHVGGHADLCGHVIGSQDGIHQEEAAHEHDTGRAAHAVRKVVQGGCWRRGKNGAGVVEGNVQRMCLASHQWCRDTCVWERPQALCMASACQALRGRLSVHELCEPQEHSRETETCIVPMAMSG